MPEHQSTETKTIGTQSTVPEMRRALRKRVQAIPESLLFKTLELASATNGGPLSFEQRKYWESTCYVHGVSLETAVDAAVAYYELNEREPPPPAGTYRFFMPDPKNEGQEIEFNIAVEFRIEAGSVSAYEAEMKLNAHRRSLLSVLAAYGQTFSQGEQAWKRLMQDDVF
jgi:hypothetical protein